MPRPTAVIESALLAKGMERDENHHHMYRKTIDGVTHLVTRVSHSGKEVGDRIATLMAHQCCLRLQEFWDLVDCPLDEAGWTALVTERCADGRNPFLGR